MSDIKTNYGRLSGVIDQATFCRGKIKSCNFEETNRISTAFGTLVPHFSKIPKGQRQRDFTNAMTFYDNGRLQSITLEEATLIPTTAGQISAELITFYREGGLKEIFPLNGKIDRYWSEADESGLADPMTLHLAIGQVTARVRTLVFYPGGELKNVVLWHGETCWAQVVGVKIPIRHGFSLYEDGGLRSVEPYEPTVIHSPIGDLMAFDPEAQEGYTEAYSLCYGKDGQVKSLTTHMTAIDVQKPNQAFVRYEPHQQKEGSVEGGDTLAIKFDEGQIFIEDHGDVDIYDLNDYVFTCHTLIEQ